MSSQLECRTTPHYVATLRETGMPSKKPGISVRIWISVEDQERVKALSDTTEVTQVEIMTRILHAGIEALSKNNRLTLPLRFEVKNSDSEENRSGYVLSEPSPARKRKE